MHGSSLSGFPPGVAGIDPMNLSALSAASANKAMAAAAPPKYKKAPDAPKRFKSAFIIFSAEKHKEIKEDLAKQGRAEKVSQHKTIDCYVWRCPISLTNLISV